MAHYSSHTFFLGICIDSLSALGVSLRMSKILPFFEHFGVEIAELLLFFQAFQVASV